ncbi:MAG: hypothetical protein DHS20C18_03600 [Saprospiraceae bacterium]|nr:MAG: hypothetical protein DHS20C18_03600 [Saprospiraceae bacterium]
MWRLIQTAISLATLIACAACEETFIPETDTSASEIVVEGYIEAGDRPAPPYVILTRSFPFFREINADQLDASFVHDAVIKVSSGEQSIELTEICYDELDATQKELAAQLFGLDPDSVGFNFCAYVDLSFSMQGEEGKTYQLSVDVEGKTLTASTHIPIHVPLESLHFFPPPGEPNDTLLQLRCVVNDPPGEANYYRYLTKTNDEPFLASFTSVTDDRLFDGQNFEFPLAKAEPPGTEIDPLTFGLYTRGDTLNLKWVMLDKAHFDFWNTLEFNAANQGPFSSYTRVAHNIEGGLGIWGGLSATYYEMVVTE